MLGLVWVFPHGPPYCFRLFHTTTRSKFRPFKMYSYSSVLLHSYFLFIRGSKLLTATINSSVIVMASVCHHSDSRGRVLTATASP